MVGVQFWQIGISIHAPPRGATVYGYNDLQTPSISIHAPPRGATLGEYLGARC